jgi:hypothetical protein
MRRSAVICDMRLVSRLRYFLNVLPQDSHLAFSREFHIRGFFKGCLDFLVFLTHLYRRQALKGDNLREKRQPSLVGVEVLLTAPVEDGNSRQHWNWST